jgi:hypothetical protein
MISKVVGMKIEDDDKYGGRYEDWREKENEN